MKLKPTSRKKMRRQHNWPCILHNGMFSKTKWPFNLKQAILITCMSSPNGKKQLTLHQIRCQINKWLNKYSRVPWICYQRKTAKRMKLHTLISVEDKTGPLSSVTIRSKLPHNLINFHQLYGMFMYLLSPSKIIPVTFSLTLERIFVGEQRPWFLFSYVLTLCSNTADATRKQSFCLHPRIEEQTKPEPNLIKTRIEKH